MKIWRAYVSRRETWHYYYNSALWDILNQNGGIFWYKFRLFFYDFFHMTLSSDDERDIDENLKYVFSNRITSYDQFCLYCPFFMLKVPLCHNTKLLQQHKYTTYQTKSLIIQFSTLS